MKLLLLILCIGGCVVGSMDDSDEVVTLAAQPDYMKRVVLGRAYQKKDWTLPNAGATTAERIAYICNAYKPLRPTYVSGLIRLDDDAPFTADQIALFQGVKACLPNAKFDVVLNAEHYTDPTRHASGRDSLAALKLRADEIKSQLGAQIIFFDFFNSPYNDGHADWYRDALTDGTRYIRNTLGMKVGGNVWGLELPPHSDFVALDNFDREHMDGYAFNKLQIERFRGRVPVLLHIENNPQKAGSAGLRFINGDTEFRRSVIDKFASDQRSERFSYMFPVFFPLKCCAGGMCGPETCDDQPSDRIAYDASRDGNVLQKIDEGLGQ